MGRPGAVLFATSAILMGFLISTCTEAKMADMTHVLNNASQTWPGFIDFVKTKVKYGIQPDGLW